MNKALSKVEEEVEKCAKKQEVVELAQDQQLVTEALCAENCTARWLWKGANLLAGQQIPWEVQATNTCPENFIWEKSKPTVMMQAPGLY